MKQAFLSLALGAACVSAEHPLGYFVYLRNDLKVSAAVSQHRAVLDAPGFDRLPRAVRRQAVYDHRRALADHTQGAVASLLDSFGVQSVSSVAAVSPAQRKATAKGKTTGLYESLWIVNALYVLPGEMGVMDAELMSQLTTHPSVLKVERDRQRASVAPRLEQRKVSSSEQRVITASNELQWNVEKILADQAWERGADGSGVTVCNIDTGVRHTHVSLKESYRGYTETDTQHDYHWFDPKEFANDPWWCDPDWPLPPECVAEYPFDNNGHGTHTMGTIAGSRASGVGVAPGAKWIAAKGCRDGGCFDYGLTLSMQWALCPTDLRGNNPRCDLGADVVSNSWGGAGGDRFRMDTIIAWREAGIVPVFSNGNSGPGCGTASSPGDMDMVIGVGATDLDDSLTAFSSRGPSVRETEDGFATQKPDLSAPGRAIISAHSSMGMTDDERYQASSGTSMAAPHIAGVVALMLSQSPTLNYDEIYRALTQTANTTLGNPEAGGPDSCEDLPWNRYPNLHYGYGRVDAVNAIGGSSSQQYTASQ